MGHFWERRPARRTWRWPGERRSLADRILETPSIWLDAIAGAIISLPPISLLESRARKAARQARREARAVAEGGRRLVKRRAIHARADARTALHDIAAELDRLGGEAARLAIAAERELRPRRRGRFARMLRAPTTGERVAEGAGRARKAGANVITDIAAPLLSLWLTASGHAADWSAGQARKAADAALDRRPRGWFSWLIPPKARRVERIKAQTAAARAESAARLDGMKAKLEDMLRRAMALGDGEAAQKAREALDRLSRLRLTITEDPPAPNILHALAQAIGARPETPATKVRVSTPLWPFAPPAAPGPWPPASQSGGSTLVAAVAAVATYAFVQALAPRPRRATAAAKGEERDASSPAVAARSAQPEHERAPPQ